MPSVQLASPTGFEPVRLQNGPLIPKCLGHANHRFRPTKAIVLRRSAANLRSAKILVVSVIDSTTMSAPTPE
jgi:hypothetical protein